MLTDTSANGVCTILLPTQGAGPVLLGVAVSGTQRQLSHPALTNSVPNSVPALPPTIGIQWRGAWSGHCSPTHAVTGQSSNGDRSPMVITLKLAHPPRHQQERLSCDAQMRNVACSRTWQLVAGSGSSPTFWLQDLFSHPPQVLVGGGRLSPTHATTWLMRGCQVSHAHSQLTCSLINRVSSAVLPRRGRGTTIPSVAAGKWVSSLTNWRQ